MDKSNDAQTPLGRGETANVIVGVKFMNGIEVEQANHIAA